MKTEHIVYLLVTISLVGLLITYLVLSYSGGGDRNNKKGTTSTYTAEEADDAYMSTLTNKDAVILFYSDGCRHCKDMLPVFNQLKSRDAKICRYNLAKNKGANEYNIQTVPHIIRLKQGKAVDVYQGGPNLDTLRTFVMNSNNK